MIDGRVYGVLRCLVEHGMATVTVDDRAGERQVRLARCRLSAGLRWEPGERLRLLSVFEAPEPRYVGHYKQTGPMSQKTSKRDARAVPRRLRRWR